MSSDDAALSAVEAIHRNDLYVLTHPEFNELFKEQVTGTLESSHSVSSASGSGQKRSSIDESVGPKHM